MAAEYYWFGFIMKVLHTGRFDSNFSHISKSYKGGFLFRKYWCICHFFKNLNLLFSWAWKFELSWLKFAYEQIESVFKLDSLEACKG